MKLLFAVLLTSCMSLFAEKPNIILIMIDDMGHKCLESYGGTSYYSVTTSQDGVAFIYAPQDWFRTSDTSLPTKAFFTI